MDDRCLLFDALRTALEADENVRMAVLYGSLARGDEDAGSDVDLLVSFGDDRYSDRYRLVTELEHISGRKVDVANLERVQSKAPLLLYRAIDEGRVLIDRDGRWRRCSEQRYEIRLRARDEHRRQMAAAGRALEELTR